MIIVPEAKYPLEYYITICDYDRSSEQWIHESKVKISGEEYNGQNQQAAGIYKRINLKYILEKQR